MTHEHDQSRTTSSEQPGTERDDHEPGRASRSALLRKPDHAILSGLVQRKARDANGVAEGADSAVAAASSSSGSPLPANLQRKFESSLGADLSGVRVHIGGSSSAANDAVGAKAYTMGNDVHFGAGQYDPSSKGGEHLLAHEVAHTVQQSGGAQRMQFKLAVSSPGDSHEHEADLAADAMIRGARAFVSGTSGGAARDVVSRDPNDKAGDKAETDAGWDVAKAKSLLVNFAAMSTAITKTKSKLYRVSAPGFTCVSHARTSVHQLKTNADVARDKMHNVIAMANGKAIADNMIPNMIREKIVGAAVDMIMGPAKPLFEFSLGDKIFGMAKKYSAGILDKEYQALIPPAPLFEVPAVTTDNADKLSAALDDIIGVCFKLGHATEAHQALDPVLASCAAITAKLGMAGTPAELDRVAAIALKTADVDAECVTVNKVCDAALRAAVEMQHQASINAVSEIELEKRLWSEWLRTNTPPEDHGTTGVAGHPNVSIAAHLEWLGLMRVKDGKRVLTEEVELQHWVGAKVVAVSSNPFRVRSSDGSSGSATAAAATPTTKALEYTVVCVLGGTQLCLAPAKAPMLAEAELDFMPGSIVTVVDHLTPRGTVMTEQGIVPATTGGGIAVASGSRVPVLKLEEGTLVVDAAKAVAGTPYAQYGQAGVSPDTHFPIARAIPERRPGDYGYRVETFSFQASPATKEYFVLEGYHLENNLDTVVCKKD